MTRARAPRTSAPRSSRVLLIGMLLAAITAASPARAVTPDDDAIDVAIAARAAFVARAEALRQILPRTLRTDVLLSLPPFVTDAARHVLREDDRDLASLVEQARGSTDPLVLARLACRCGIDDATRGPCDALALARRWVDADTQNQAAWLTLAEIQHWRKDEAAAKATFVRAAGASLWRDDRTGTGRALLRLLPRDLAPADRAEALRTIAAIQGLTPSAFAVVRAECDDAALLAACHRILATIYDGADTLVALKIVSGLSARSGVPAATVAERFATADATGVGLQLAALPDVDDDGAGDAAFAAFIRILEGRIERGDRAQASIDLAAAGVSTAQAAARGAQERQRRDARIADALRGRAP